MKKSKLLMPVLSIAGLGAVVAPAVAITSCSCNPQVVEPMEMEFVSGDNDYRSKAIEGDINTNTTYQVSFSVLNDSDAPNEFYLSIFHAAGEGTPAPIEQTTFSEFKLYKVDGESKTEITPVTPSASNASVQFGAEMTSGNYLIQFKVSKEVKYSTSAPLMYYAKK